MKYQKADRIIRIIEMLSRDRRPDTGELTSLFNVSKRTVFRDLSTISNVVPIIYDDGYRFLYSPPFPDFKFRTYELMLIKLGLEISALSGDVKYSSNVKAINDKLKEIFDEQYDEVEEIVGDELYIDIDMYSNYRSKTDTFIRLEKGLRRNKVVEIKYFSLYKNEETTRKVNPHSIIFKRHAWYLIAFCQLRNDFRTFRIDRIKHSRLTDERYERDENFSLKDYFHHSWELSRGTETHKVKIKFHPDIVPLIIEGNRHHSENLELLVDGSLIYNVEVSDLNEIKRWILRFGDKATVIEPQTLREDLLEISRALLEKYER